jgi:hypothetical protein
LIVRRYTHSTLKTPNQPNKQATKATLSSWFPLRFAGPAFDFVSSAVSTTICSVISTPQMVLTDRIMAGCVFPPFLWWIKRLRHRW